MNPWQQSFVEKVQSLRERAGQHFEVVAQEVVEPAYQEFSDFTSNCDFQSSMLQSQFGVRSFKFGLSEDGFVLCFFRNKGVGGLEFCHECYVPGTGRIESKTCRVALPEASPEWTRQCFEKALDAFVTHYSEVDALASAPVGAGVG